MADKSITQTIKDAEVDARSLSEFISKDASFTVTRRLAPTIHTLDYYLQMLDSVDAQATVAQGVVDSTISKMQQLEPMVVQMTNDAIDNTVLENGVVTDALVIADGQQTQRALNTRIARGYPSVSSMVADSALKAGQVARTSGFYGVDDMGSATYYVIPRSEADLLELNYWESGDIKSYASFLLPSGGVAVIGHMDEYRLEQFGAVGNGIDDCYEPFMTALNLHSYGTGYYQSSPTIKLMTGKTYFVSQRINIKKSVKIYGDGSGLPTNSSPKVKFAAGSSGFIVNRYNTYDNEVGAATTGGDATTLEGFQVIGQRGSPDINGGHGILLRARAVVSRMSISSFEGDGVHIYALAGSGNANNFSLSEMRVGACHNGVYAQGADANAGTGYAIDATGNRAWGIWDNSFLGNTWIGCHTANNGKDYAYAIYEGSYYHAKQGTTPSEWDTVTPGTDSNIWIPNMRPTSLAKVWEEGMPAGSFHSGGGYCVTGSSSRAAFLACYSEGGQGFTQGNSGNALFVGGNLEASEVFGVSPWLKGANGSVDVPNGLASTNIIGDNTLIRSYGGTDRDILSWRWRIGAQYQDRWNLTAAAADNSVYLTMFNSPLYKAFSVYPIDNQWQSKPVLHVEALAGGTTGVYACRIGFITWAAGRAEPPTAGSFRKGDKFFASDTSNGYTGVICTVAGDAGSTAVFKKFGQIESDV